MELVKKLSKSIILHYAKSLVDKKLLRNRKFFYLLSSGTNVDQADKNENRRK